MVWLTVIPLALLLVRNFPENLGPHWDGAAQPPEREVLATDGANYPRRILTSPAFYLLAVPRSANSFFSTTLIFVQVSIFANRALGAGAPAATFVLYSLAAAATTPRVSLLLGRVGVRWPYKEPETIVRMKSVEIRYRNVFAIALTVLR